MIYLALLFLLLFIGFFVRETFVSLRRGSVISYGQHLGRQDRPILFWLGIAAWVLNISAGILLATLLAWSKLGSVSP